MKSIDTEGILTKYLEAFSRHDVDAMVASCAPDVLHLHQFPRPVIGLKALRKDKEAFFRAFPDLRVEPGRLVTTGDWGASEFVLRGTHKGPLETPKRTIPPTNRSVEMRVAGFWRLNSEGLVAEEHYYFDRASIRKQLGIKPKS